MELALLVWASEVLPSMASLLGVVSIVGIIISGLILFFLILDGEPSHYDRHYNKEAYDRKFEQIKVLKKVTPYFFGAFILLLVLTSLVPSQKTIYMMAGAYGAQTIASSDAGKRVVKILENKLDEILLEQEEKLNKNGGQQSKGK